MIRTEKVQSIMLIFTLCCAFVISASAGTIVEEFDSPKLESRLWEVRAVGGASFEIEDGQLTMESPAVEDGILLAYIHEITGEDITFEFKFDVSEGGDPSAQIWFGDVPLTPDLNVDVNTHWKLVQTILSPVTYVKNFDGKVIQDTPIDIGPNVYKFVLLGDDVTFFVNEKEIATIRKEDDMSYFHIVPDMYTSHYGGRIGILDYVKISGPNVRPLAVEPEGKLAATWAELKK